MTTASVGANLDHAFGDVFEPKRNQIKAGLSAWCGCNRAAVCVLHHGLADASEPTVGVVAECDVPAGQRAFMPDRKISQHGLGVQNLERSNGQRIAVLIDLCLLYTSPSPRDRG